MKKVGKSFKKNSYETTFKLHYALMRANDEYSKCSSHSSHPVAVQTSNYSIIVNERLRHG
jgi:hypothetical protein